VSFEDVDTGKGSYQSGVEQHNLWGLQEQDMQESDYLGFLLIGVVLDL